MAPRPSAAEVAGASKMQLTSNDNELLTSLFAHAKSAPDVDWDKVGGDLGLKDGKNARQRFTRLCTKMGWSATGSGGSAGATTTDASLATPATPGDSPAKVTKRKGRVGTKGGAKAKKVMASEDDDEEEDVNMADIPETPAAKSKAKAKAAKKPAQKKEGAVKEEEQSDEDKKNFKDSDDDEEKLDSKGSPASYHDEV